MFSSWQFWPHLLAKTQNNDGHTHTLSPVHASAPPPPHAQTRTHIYAHDHDRSSFHGPLRPNKSPIVRLESRSNSKNTGNITNQSWTITVPQSVTYNWTISWTRFVSLSLSLCRNVRPHRVYCTCTTGEQNALVTHFSFSSPLQQ